MIFSPSRRRNAHSRRTSRARAHAIAAFFAFACFATVAQAQPEAEARRLFEQGVALAQEERWTEALSAFQRSRTLVDRPSTVFNIAVAELRLARPTRALPMFDEYMKQATAAPREKERMAEAARLRVEAVAMLAKIDLQVEPADTTVEIDGAQTDGSRSFELDPGEHRFRFSAAGHEPASMTLTLEAGTRQTKRVTLVPIVVPAKLRVESNVSEAVIRIGNETIGRHRVETQLSPGTYRLEVRAPDYEPFRRNLQLLAGTQTNVDATLRETRSFWSNPVLWIAAGGVVVAAATIITILLVTSSSAEDPYGGSTDVVIETVR